MVFLHGTAHEFIVDPWLFCEASMSFRKKDRYIVAVADATDAVMKELLEILEERRFPVEELLLFGEEQSAGEKIDFQGKKRVVSRLSKESFLGADIAFLSLSSQPGKDYARIAVASGCKVIDVSGSFRGDQDASLVVPEIHAAAFSDRSGIICNPSVSAIALCLALKPIQDAVGVTRIVATTFQSVSGMGRKGIDELAGQTVALLNFKDIEPKLYSHQIAFNCIPHVSEFHDFGSTREETEIIHEVRNILSDDSIQINLTAVRIPVFRCDSYSVYVETRKAVSANEVRAVLSEAPGIMVYDDPQKNLYPTPIEVAGKDELYIGRIRQDESVPNGVNLWMVLDNLRKGSALNAVQIAEKLIC
ncbi:MAG: aspartate-semialdehyde dehydrogenase [Nitrospirota bacterium]